MALRSMSFSSWALYAACPKQYQYYTEDKNKYDGQSDAAARGERLHTLAEEFIRDTPQEQWGKVPKELQKLTWFFNRLRATPMDLIIPEQAFACTFQGVPAEWFGKEVIRAKIDLLWKPKNESVLYVVDYKTGKEYDKHDDQLDFYAVLARRWATQFHIEFDEVKAACIYIDNGGQRPYGFRAYNQARLDALDAEWFEKMHAVASADTFTYKPGHPQCSWCKYAKKKNGPCMFGS